MCKINKLGSIFLLFCILLTTSFPSFAANIEGLNWLPFLNAKIKRLQPDKHCPQNQILDLQVNKKDLQITGSIGKVDWDLDCLPATDLNQNEQSKIPSQQVSSSQISSKQVSQY